MNHSKGIARPLKKHNFNSGPAVLPDPVFREASEAVLNYQQTGLSILEIGHRSPEFIRILEEARNLVKELLNLREDREVLFLHGGASTQFMQVPMNLLGPKETVAIADTGVWSAKAIKEASLFGKVEVVCSSKEKNYRFIPKDFAVPNDAKYLHITSNNTIYGTQWRKLPKTSLPLVADMSSDIFCNPIDYNVPDLIYAGAQKNVGAAGVTLVIVNKNILGTVKRSIPTMLDYRNHIEAQSLLNTAPVFAIYVCLLNLRWLKAQGGVSEMAKLNAEKAAMLYAEIDRHPLFEGTVAKEDRSTMNACFVIKDRERENDFLKHADEAGIVGIKGHRISGGFRASLYNALPKSSVEFLVETMQNFS